MRIELEQSAALVIDYQEKLVPVMFEKERLIENTCILLAGLHTLHVPICVTQQYTKGLGSTVEEVVHACKVTSYTEKLRFSAYEDTAEFLKGKRFVIVCGIETHICVLQTVVDLKANGYIPVLVTDCVSSRKEQDMMTAIQRAGTEGAILTTYESLLFELLKKAGTDTSKQIQRLIK